MQTREKTIKQTVPVLGELLCTKKLTHKQKVAVAWAARILDEVLDEILEEKNVSTD